jgi:hypothetical protein
MRLLSPARAATLAAAGALVASTMAVAPAPANAAVLITPQLAATVDFSFFPSSGACTQVGADAAQTIAFDADGVARTASASSSATVTHNTDATDVTTLNGSVTSTATAQQSGGQLSKVTVTTNYSASVSSTLGAAQKCGSEVGAVGGAQYAFDLVAPTLVTVTVNAHGGIAQAIAGQGLFGPGSEIAIAGAIGAGQHSTSTGTVVLPAGTNFVAMQVHQDGVDAPSPTNSRTSASGNATMTVTFQKPGNATTGADGSGKKYLAPAAGRDCTAGTLSATWKSKAGKGENRKVKKAVFYVNDKLVKTVKKPKKKDVTKLTKLDPEQAAHLEVVIQLAKKGAGKVSVERDYLPCT